MMMTPSGHQEEDIRNFEKDRERFKGLQRKKKLISELNGDD